MDKVAALVLAGGHMGDYGVLTQNRAKGALTVAGIYRIIDFALSNLVNSGINHIGLIIQYLPGSLIEHVGSGQPWDLDNYGKHLKIMPPFVGIAHTAWFKGTADAIFQNMNFVNDMDADHVILLSGEHVFNLDFQETLQAHKRLDADITVVTRQVTPEQHCKRFGYVNLDDEGRILAYHEKPATPPSDIAATGIYIFKASVLNKLLHDNQDDDEHNLPKDILQKYVAEYKTYEFRHHGCWEYMENVRDYYDAQYRLMHDGHYEKIRQWNILTNLKFRNVGHAAAAQFGRNSKVTGSMVSPKCNIQGTVHNSILSPGVSVAAGAIVSNSILLHDCTIEENVILDHVISDRDAKFCAGCVIGKLEEMNVENKSSENMIVSTEGQPLTLIGKAAVIGEGIVIQPGSQVRPGKSLSSQDEVKLEI